MVHLSVALGAFQRDDPHAHWSPQEHPLLKVVMWVRRCNRSDWAWGVVPILPDILSQLPTRLIEDVGNPLPVTWLDDPEERLG